MSLWWNSYEKVNLLQRKITSKDQNLCLILVVSLLGSLRVLSLVPSSSLCTPRHSVLSVTHSLSYNCCADDTQLILHHLKFILDKTELLLFQGRPTISIKINSSLVPAPWMPRNLGVTLDDMLSFAATARSCRSMLYNIKRIRLFPTQKASQDLVEGLLISRLKTTTIRCWLVCLICHSSSAAHPECSTPLAETQVLSLYTLTCLHLHLSETFIQSD